MAKEKGAGADWASKGGQARAAALTPEERRSIAVAAAEARWGTRLPVAEYTGQLEIGDLVFPCAVLSDGTRVLTQSDFMKGMGMYYSGWVAKNTPAERDAEIPHFLRFKSLKPFVKRHLGDMQTLVVPYRTTGGQTAHGIRAEIIPKLCDVWIDADEEGSLGSRQKLVAAKARILMRALAHVGITALVDEVTGFQRDRDQDALAKYLAKYIQDELKKWVSTFPKEFFEQIHRLKGLGPLPANMRLPMYFGKIVNDLVYDRLAHGVRDELAKRNPVTQSGRRKHRHHQYLTEDLGHPKLLHHLGLLIGMAYTFGDGEYEKFYDAVNARLPNQRALPLFAQTEREG